MNDDANILLIAGPGRSGTTALTDYLNIHPEVFICRERYKFAIPEVNPSVFTTDRILGSREGETNIPERYDARTLAGKDLSKVKWVGDKNPNYVRQLELLSQNNPGARFILTYRPVEEVAESHDARSKNPNDPWLRGKNGFEVGVRAWNLAMRKTREFLEKGDSEALIVSYDDFFHENEACVPLISRFLDLEFDESIRETWREMSRRFTEDKKRDKSPLDEEQTRFVRKNADRAAEEWVLERIWDQWKELGPEGKEQASAAQICLDGLRIENLKSELAQERRKTRRMTRRMRNTKRQLEAVSNSRTWRLLDGVQRLRAGVIGKAKARVPNRRGSASSPLSLNTLRRVWLRLRPDPGNKGRLLTREASAMLVSFCNVKSAGKPFLALVDLRGEERNIRWIGVKEDIYYAGATGLCFWNGLVCVALQNSPKVPAGFVLLDPASDFEQVSEGTLPPDVHSVCSKDGDLYFAVSGRNSVYRATFDNAANEWKTSRHWTLPGSSGTADENHVNAIGHVGGELCVSGFELKMSAATWDSATRGFIYNVDKGEYVMRGIHHPHSFLEDTRTVWTCESKENRLVSGDGEERGFPSSYLRGLAIDKNYFYTGSSKRRVRSKSTGELNVGITPEMRGSCCVYRSARGSGEPQLVVDFSEFRDEIYDILLF